MFKYWKTTLFAIIILLLCLIPSEELTKIDIFSFNYQDLFVHLIMFLIFSFLLAWELKQNVAFKENKNKQLLTVIISGVLLGFITETFQYIFPSLHRTPNVADLLFDMVGIACTVVTIKFIKS